MIADRIPVVVILANGGPVSKSEALWTVRRGWPLVVIEGPDLTWQERVDLQPEDEVESDSEIYYFTDEDGNIHSREFLADELVPDEVVDQEDLIKGKPRHILPSTEISR
jgi:hypothetical protein